MDKYIESYEMPDMLADAIKINDFKKLYQLVEFGSENYNEVMKLILDEFYEYVKDDDHKRIIKYLIDYFDELD